MGNCTGKIKKKENKSKIKEEREVVVVDLEPMKFCNRDIDIIPILSGNTTRNCLVVDDAQSNRYVLKSYLTRKNLNVECACNGEEAIKIVQEKSDLNYFDVIWADIKMPVMDGYQLTENLRTLGFKKLIIGVTGNIQHRFREKCFASGMNDVIAKPIIKDIFYNHTLFAYYDSLDK